MAAYASLVSIMHTIDQIQLHPQPPISLDKAQVESLTEKITFLQEFLEGYSLQSSYNNEADPLEMRIADVAYAAEDVIESHIVDQIRTRSNSEDGEKISIFSFCKCFRGPRKDVTDHEDELSFIDQFYQSLQKVIGDMDLIKKEAMEIKEKGGIRDRVLRSSRPDISFKSSSTTMVGFDDVLLEVMDKLTGGKLDRQIIPIVGMGGIGKTTLARNIYQNQIIVQRFDILVWVTISQEYKMKEILSKLLQEGGNWSRMNEYELGEKLYKRLSGRRYLIIIDDIWDVEVWDRLKIFIPDNKNGSRIMLTTRLANLASHVADSDSINMAFLDEDNSWSVFSKIVFGEDGCPLELEEIGKKIAKKCKGLPLSLVVIGGVLAKSEHTREYWQYVADNLNSIVNSEDSDLCTRILHMSYKELPIYLKPCLLYMGIFKEDYDIRVSMLVKLWVAEGFIKPITGRSLEVVAKEYLEELANRNLVLVQKLGSTGSIKSCNIHDLTRDFCLREARKQRFYNVAGRHSHSIPRGINTQSRIIIPESLSYKKISDALPFALLHRALIDNDKRVLHESPHVRRLRIWKSGDYGEEYLLENMFSLFNLRFIDVLIPDRSKFPSSVYLLWNLQTLVVEHNEGVIDAPAEIWKMSQLRHVRFQRIVCLPDLPCGDVVLENLLTLRVVTNFKCDEEMVRRIPNLKKLQVYYMNSEEASLEYLNNIHLLHKLESFRCHFGIGTTPVGASYMRKLTFPHSLKKLTLEASRFQHWEDALEKIGSLPHLEKLLLAFGSFKGRRWGTVEGQFRSLKFLQVRCCVGLECWTTTERCHFPRLEHLVLSGLDELKEVPPEIGEIPTLKSIELHDCSYSAIISAKKIVEEQEELHGEVALQVRIRLPLWKKNEEWLSLAGPNFQVLRR